MDLTIPALNIHIPQSLILILAVVGVFTVIMVGIFVIAFLDHMIRGPH